MNENPASERTILVLDPDSSLVPVSRFLSGTYSCETAGSADECVELAANLKPLMVFSNYTVDTLSGLELIETLSFVSRGSSVVFFADESDKEHAIDAFRAGAFDFIVKPFKLEYTEAVIERALREKERQAGGLSPDAVDSVLAANNERLEKRLRTVEMSFRMTLNALVRALETRDFETYGHSERAVTFSLRLGFELGMDDDSLLDLELGALLHDVGKVGVPDGILRKPARLTPQEWEKMKLHPILGSKILANIPLLEGAARVVSQHHEHWDGNGYPLGLKGEAIDLGARVFAVIDAFDAMISDRIYRAGRSYYDAVAEIERCAGSQFDPTVVEAFRAVPEEHWDFLRSRSIADKTESISFKSVVEDLYRSGLTVDLVH